jgi:protein SCO1/2
MDRRHYLQSLGTAGVAATAGCLNAIPLIGGRTVLAPPEQDLSEAAHPSHGDDIPSVSLPDPLSGEEISTTQFEGERAYLMTFIYTNCPDGMCPALTLRLRRAQEVAAEGGYGDQAAFLEVTFDPERDTADVLRTYGKQQGVDLDAGNWHFLRPESYEAGKELIEEHFGLVIKKIEADGYEKLDYIFPHYNLILLVNKRGVVERAYPNAVSVDIDRIVGDFETVVTA